MLAIAAARLGRRIYALLDVSSSLRRAGNFSITNPAMEVRSPS